MKIERKKVADRIVLLTFQSRFDLTSSLLRFQEHYESPEFRGKIFTLEEYQKWYIVNSPEGQKTGKFTYYDDWNGFNFPSHVLTPFFAGDFNPLSEKEEQIVRLLRPEAYPFYTIGIHRQNKISTIIDVLNHEIAHGLFYTDVEYRKKVLAEMQSEDLSELRNKLRSLGGYHESVLDDELHAYSLRPSERVKSDKTENLKQRLERIFAEHAKLNNVIMPGEFIQK
ncbi:Uncharacterised protein [uncultured archaeon]|nr:Uncharacterised protein [uncultured archaeon]